MAISQTDTILVNGFSFVSKASAVANEWETKDTLSNLYRIENGELKWVLKYYTFKDDGGDCNNLFWQTEEVSTNKNLMIFNTTFFQKTNMDPIPTQRRQIYSVSSKGKLALIFDKYRYRHSKEWVGE